MWLASSWLGLENDDVEYKFKVKLLSHEIAYKELGSSRSVSIL